jgi:uncharacterized protein YndB with AHSA1/START domain
MRVVASGADRLVLRDEFPGIEPGDFFACWTTPALLSAWWPREAAIEPRVGGTYTLSWPEQGWRLQGRYTTFELGRRLGFTWSWEHEPEAPVTEVLLELGSLPGGGTDLTLTHQTYDASPGGQEMRMGHLEGWTHFLGRLHEVTDKGTGSADVREGHAD